MVSGQRNPNHRWDVHRRSMFLLTPVRAKGTNISPRVLHKRLLLHKQARKARVWVEVEDMARRLGHQGPKGVSTQLYHRLANGSVSYTRYVSAILPMGRDIV